LILYCLFCWVWFFSVRSQEIGWAERLRNDLFCVEWDVKPCSFLLSPSRHASRYSRLRRLSASRDHWRIGRVTYVTMKTPRTLRTMHAVPALPAAHKSSSLKPFGSQQRSTALRPGFRLGDVRRPRGHSFPPPTPPPLLPGTTAIGRL